VFLVLGFLMTLQNPAAQQPQRNDTRTWSQAYVDAQRSVQQRNWEQAIANIEAARRLGAPNPGRNVLFGGDVYRDFNPDYYLGVAYLNLGRFADADRAFESVTKAQLIRPTDASYKEFSAQVTTTKFELLMGDAQQALSQDRLDQASEGAKSARALGVQSTRIDALEKQIADRRIALAPKPIEPAAPKTVVNTPTPNPTEQTTANAGGTNAAGPATAPVQQSPVQQPVRPPAQASPPRAGAANAARATTSSQPWTPLPGEDERGAMVRFFSGDYKSAVTYLTNIVSLGTPTPRAYLYLASSRAALVLTGAAPRSEMDAARSELARAGDTTRFAADKALISPRILQALGMQQ